MPRLTPLQPLIARTIAAALYGQLVSISSSSAHTVGIVLEIRQLLWCELGLRFAHGGNVSWSSGVARPLTAESKIPSGGAWAAERRRKFTRPETHLHKLYSLTVPLMTHSLATFKSLLGRLVLSIPLPDPPSGKLRDPGMPLSQGELHALLEHLADVEFTRKTEHGAAIGAALTALRLTGLDQQPDTLAYMRSTFLSKTASISLPQRAPPAGSSFAGFVDMVGTGGDGQDTFNVSTTAMFVAAGIEGLRVCKHGGKASTSSSGSAELLIALGIPLLDVPASSVTPLLTQNRCTFFLAPKFHSAMLPLAPIRASLGFPTIFNILGPLINPARPARGIFGVHSSGIGEMYANTLRLAGMEQFWVVCGQEGLDEISPAGPTDVWELRDGRMRHFTVSPADFGLPTHPLLHVRCGSAAENAAVVMHMLRSREPLADAPLPTPLTVASDAPSDALVPVPAGVNLGAIRDYTLIQAAALAHVAGYGEGDLKKCVALATDSIASGAALSALRELRDSMQAATT